MNGQGKLLVHFLRYVEKLIIPVYQRNYDWQEANCRKLYQDLVYAIRSNKRWHFFGSIVSVSDPMGSNSEYLLIDGQQRITTVSLLLLAMANLIKEGKVTPENDDLYAQITKKYLVDEINPQKRKMKLKPIRTLTSDCGVIRRSLTARPILHRITCISIMRFRNKPLLSISFIKR